MFVQTKTKWHWAEAYATWLKHAWWHRLQPVLPTFLTVKLEHAGPIRVLADVAIISQVLQNCAPHFKRVHRALCFEKHLAVHADQRRERKPATPFGVERGDGIGRISPFKQ